MFHVEQPTFTLVVQAELQRRNSAAPYECAETPRGTIQFLKRALPAASKVSEHALLHVDAVATMTCSSRISGLIDRLRQGGRAGFRR